MMFMNEALRIAQKGRFSCQPNPMVGCVIVKNNQIVGRGAHIKAGEAHAEINALQHAGQMAKDADVYVTLEPCCHFGRTPPCVDALIKAGVKSVHVAILDPNPLVAGKGITLLGQAGITTFIGECQEEAYQLNKSFFYYITHKKPFVSAKWAMSLDGKIASATPGEWGPNRWITSEDARKHTHMIRASVSGIIVGENTVRIDNPELTVRYNDFCGEIPRPIVLTAYGNLAHDTKLFQPGRNTLVITSKNVSSEFVHMLNNNGIEYCIVSDKNGFLDLSEILNQLGERKISTVLVEGGAQLLTEFFNQHLVHTLYTYIAPKIIGNKGSLSPLAMAQKWHEDMNVKEVVQLGEDICFVTETLLTNCTYDDFIKRRDHV